MISDYLPLSSWLGSGLAWFILGAVLLIIELATSGFLALFFAIGAWITAILLWIGLIGGNWLTLAVFLVSSVTALFLLRRRLRAVVGGSMGLDTDTEAKLDEFAGKIATVVESINAARNTGKVEFRGTQWLARADRTIERGSTVRIVARDNLTLTVKSIEG
ncbi:MAG: hypothetical protein A2Z06_04050 [Candidatus Glassbacteria bacterium RBG_16_58_8]|uniref:NfeD-like C-terminal domain-containing protein n=1 Tax=Candidatus Glassbacteria bacterium RBG_16_58_8 TaxID=1817866 RepID=A0A1F5YCH8_9BACT|nr:MAG: hypothetical protein A2Z06_04050 [Candidatus Glassbacteria bacterium RBG_16_58_8]